MLRCVCDTCGTAASTVYCHTDSTYLCSGCDNFIHAEANPMAGHHFRVPIQTTANPSISLLYGEFSALNQCQVETAAAAAREEYFFYGSETAVRSDDLVTLTSTRSDDVVQTSCGPHWGIQRVFGDMSVPIVPSLELNQSLQRTKHPEVGTIQAPSVYTPPNCQTVQKSVTYSIKPEIALSFTTPSSQRLKAKAVECLGQPSAENPISRQERVQRFREKRKAKQLKMKLRFPSKKAYAASIRPRINGKFARRPIDKKVELN